MVVDNIDFVVDAVVEVVECGVALASENRKCGLIGCAFGLIGLAADIAFTVVTGGIGRVTEAACAITDAIQFDSGADDESNACQTAQCLEDRRKRQRNNVLGSLLQGVGTSVCAINTKLNVPVLTKICDISEQVSSVDNGLIVVDAIVQNPAVFRFLEALREAVCGSPGSAIFDLLEEVVSCFIGCADQGNAFCQVVQEDIPENISTTVSYRKVEGRACRTSGDNKGDDGDEFTLFLDSSEAECEKKCTDSLDCKGWEYNDDQRCEIWHVVPTLFDRRSGFDCYVKNTSN